MNYKIYENVLSNNIIDELLNYTKTNDYQIGKVGNRVNLNQKIRNDYFISSENLITKIDNIVYDQLYNNVCEHFSTIKYREKWKIGHYLSDNEGFYNFHTDDARETKYRKTSMVCALSDPNDYEGGELFFKDLNKTFKLQKGSVIVFKSSLLHGVKAVTKGQRYVMISFFFDDHGYTIRQQLHPNIIIANYIPKLNNIKIEYNHNTKIVQSGNLIKTLQEPMEDIDYSDKHSHSWSDKDDYYFEDNDSDILIITFAGMGWKTSLPTFIFHNFLKDYKNIDKLFVRDLSCRYYLTCLKNNTSSLEETIKFLEKCIFKKVYSKIIALGCSSGGFAAILFGHLLKFTKVVVFSPQTVLTNKKEDIIQDSYNAPKTCQWLRNLNKTNEFYQKCLDLKNFIPFNTTIDIHYSKNANNGADKKHAQYIESGNCKIIEHDGRNHLLALEFRDSGKLKEIIDELIT
jgi:predicted 2-oxoglutarate/Fe(II)-dependent dioxygenase YbiX